MQDTRTAHVEKLDALIARLVAYRFDAERGRTFEGMAYARTLEAAHDLFEIDELHDAALTVAAECNATLDGDTLDPDLDGFTAADHRHDERMAA